MSGIKTAYWIDQFETIFEQLIKRLTLFTLIVTNTLELRYVETRTARLMNGVKKYNVPIRKAAPFMHELRAVKHPLRLNYYNAPVTLPKKDLGVY